MLQSQEKLTFIPAHFFQVDCVLAKLLELGFDRFARLGDLTNVSRKLLPHAVHHRGGNEEHVKKLKVTDKNDLRTSQSVSCRFFVQVLLYAEVKDMPLYSLLVVV